MKHCLIIELTSFDMLVKNKKRFLAQIISGAVGGAYLGLTKVVTNVFVFSSVTAFPSFIVDNANVNVINEIIGLMLSVVVGVILGLMLV